MTAEEWYAADIAARQADLSFRQQQHAEKMAAEAACAAAQQAVASAVRDSTVAMSLPIPARLPTRAELVFAILRDHPQATIMTNSLLVNGCKGIVDAYVAAFPTAVQP